MPTSKLESIEVVAYRGLRDLRLDNLGSITLLFGPNNCGKTSVLEAVSVFTQPLDLSQWLSVVFLRDPGRVGENRLLSLRWCFPQSGPSLRPPDEGDDYLFRSEAEIRGKGMFPVRQLNVSYSEIIGEVSREEMSRRPWRYRPGPRGPQDFSRAFHRGAEIAAHAHVEPGGRIESDILTVWEDAPVRMSGRSAQPAIPVQFITASSYHLGRLAVQLIHSIRSDDQKAHVVEVLRKFDPDVIDVEISSSRGFRATVYVKHAHLGYAPLAIFGDGMRRAVVLLAAVARARDGILLLDEIDTGIHISALPSVVGLLIDAALRFNVQVFAATHSLDAIDAFAGAREHLDQVVAYRLPPSGTEELAARLPGEALYELRYESGKRGALVHE